MREPVVDTDAVGHMVIRSRIKTKILPSKDSPYFYGRGRPSEAKAYSATIFKKMIIVNKIIQLDYRD